MKSSFNKTYKVYKHVFPNGKIYVGITCRGLNTRWKDGMGYGGTTRVGHAIAKYGWDNVKHYVLNGDYTESQAKVKERELIRRYNSLDPRYGYNMTEGGDGSFGYRHSDECKQRMKENHADITGSKNPFFGKKHSSQTKQHLRLLNLGKTIPAEVRAKMGRSGKAHPLYGKHFSEESRKKMSEAQKGERSHNYGTKFSDEHKRKISAGLEAYWRRKRGDSDAPELRESC